MSKLDLQFVGVITNVSPIHIVPPNSPIAKTADGRGEAAEVATLPVMIDNQVVRVPVIPASTIRGKLRRAATAVALSHLDAKPSLEAWLYATLGGVKGAEKEDAFDIVDRNSRRRQHPITGLFGASAPWDPSHAYISPAIPQERVSAEFVNGVRSDDFTRKAEIVSMLDDQGIPDYLAMRKGTKDRTAATQELEKAYRERSQIEKSGEERELAAVNERISSLRSKEARVRKEAGNPIQMPISHRVMPIGVRMNHKMVLRNVTPVEAGLFLAALNYVFNEDPFFGGKISLGYGSIEAEWAVSFRSGSDMKWKELDRIDASALAPIEYHSPELTQLIDDWRLFAAKPSFNLARSKKMTGADEKTGREKDKTEADV